MVYPVNENAAYDPARYRGMLPELARRYDPSADNGRAGAARRRLR